MEIKITTKDATAIDIPRKITAKWLKIALQHSVIRRDKDGRYELQLPDESLHYLTGFWNEFNQNDAMRTNEGETWGGIEIINQTIWEYRTDAAEKILDQLIDACNEFESNYDDDAPITIDLTISN